MEYENLISEAPFIGAIVIIVIAFIKYLSARDREMRRMAELFTERVGSIEKTVNSLRDTIRELKTYLIHHSDKANR
tara:strand:+ start:176 stop:403 length:228 start_codon:yes stop_codon:yes gene_type:complete